MLEGGLEAVRAEEDVVGSSRLREMEKRVRELERLFGRTMEAEILREASDVARSEGHCDTEGITKPGAKLSFIQRLRCRFDLT